MEEKINSLSLFFPAYNEEGNIGETIKNALPILQKKARDYELIVIDDGSSDNTSGVVAELSKKDSHIKLVRHSKNLGYGAALISGFKKAKYDYIVFNDGDGQFSFKEIGKFLSAVKGKDMVIGYRQKRVDPILRLILQFLLKIWALGLFGVSLRDIDCGFKLFRKEAVDKIMPLHSQGAMISTEILYRAKKKGLKIAEVSVTHYPRRIGKQTGGNLKVIWKAIVETYHLKKIYD